MIISKLIHSSFVGTEILTAVCPRSSDGVSMAVLQGELGSELSHIKIEKTLHRSTYISQMHSLQSYILPWPWHSFIAGINQFIHSLALSVFCCTLVTETST
jgi:hypothetical protein